jgi:hypothetical protein
MRNYCTYFDCNYLARGLALVASLERHDPDFRLFVVCLDEITRTLLRRIGHPNLVLVPLHELEQGDAGLREARRNRSRVEYFWTLTPTIILRLLDRVPVGSCLVYLDADLWFFSSPGPILDELDGHSILIHEHRFTPALAFNEPINGRFNVGLLGFRNDARARVVLDWWRERCIEWCYDRVEDGKMGDQKYLDSWPERFPGVRVLQHPGGGVAPWNHEHVVLDESAGGVLRVQGEPLIFYHFHAIMPLSPGIIVLARHLAYPLPLPIVRHCYLPYLACLEAGNDTLRAILPELGFGYWPDHPVTRAHALLVREERSGDYADRPQAPLGLGWNLVPGRQSSLPPA